MNGPEATSTERSARRSGLVLLAVVTLLWGVNWPVMKVVLGVMSPWTFRALVVPISGIILVMIARGIGQSIAIPRRVFLPMAAASVFNVTGWHIFSAFGLTILHSGEAALIAFTMPLWVSVLSVFVLGEAMTWRRVVALALGLSGVGLLLGIDVEAVRASPLGALHMLGAAVSWAFGVVILKKVSWGMTTLALAGWQLIVGGMPIVIAALVIEPHWPAGVPLETWLLIAFVIAGPMAFCGWGFFRIVHLFPAAVSAISTLMIPVVGVLTGAFALGEPLGLREIGAMILVGGGLASVLLRR